MAETVTTTSTPVSITLEQLKELLSTHNAGMTPEALAEAFSQTQKKENVAAPMVSMCNPLGERDHPRPEWVPKKVTQNGVTLDTDMMLAEEIEAVNALRPGSYRVEKANGTMMPFTVNDILGFDGTTVERREIWFPSKDENRTDHKSLYDYCIDVLTQGGHTDDLKRIRAMRNSMQTLRQKSR